MSAGELKRMIIKQFKDPGYSDSAGPDFQVQINPESYATEFKVAYNNPQAQGTSANQAAFTRTPPPEISFEFLFDNTGIIKKTSGNEGGLTQDDSFTNLTDKIEQLRAILVGHQGDTHEPNHLHLCWGTLLFKGRCTSLNITYKLFDPDGSPIRAICKATFTGSLEEKLRVALENNKSPDLTHFRIVKKGDTLPLMCYKIYGDSKYYLQVAQVNKLNNFRELNPGDEIFFSAI